MSFHFDGTVVHYITRNSGLETSTGLFTRLFALRVHTLKAILISPYKLADYTTSNSAHILATDSNGLSLRLYSNYLDSPTTSVVGTLVVGDWYWIALRGNGTTISLSLLPEGGTTWTTVSTTQTTFTPTHEFIGSSDSTDPDEAAAADSTRLRGWNALLTDNELLTEVASAVAVRTANLVLDNDGAGTDLANALISETGTAFTAPNGGVTLISDQPLTGGAPTNETITVSGELEVAPQVEISNASALGTVISFNGRYVSADQNADIAVTYQLYKSSVEYTAGSAEFSYTSGTFSGVLSGLPVGSYTVKVTVTDDYGTAFAESSALTVSTVVEGWATYGEDEFVAPLAGWSILAAPNDGVVDATSTIQSALNALVSTGTTTSVLYIPAGTYRITSTLNLTSGAGITIIGEDPKTTIFIWDGAADGKLLYMYGTWFSKIARLTFDGNGVARDLVHNFKELGSSLYTPSYNEFRDCIFKGSKYGLRNGNLPVNNGGSSETHVIRCVFQNNTLAGISQQDGSTLNWYIWDCAFYNNAHGITNYFGSPEVNGSGAGNFHVFRSVFKDNTVADMSIGSTSVFSARECDSEGSATFFKSLVSMTSSATVELQKNVARCVSEPVQFGQSGGATGAPGSLVMLDNQFKKSTSGPPVVFYSTAAYTDIVSVGNTYSNSPSISSQSVGARILALDDVVSAGIPDSTKEFVGFAGKVARTVYEVTVPVTSVKIQQAVDSASALSNKAYVHLPSGQHDITTKITIPENSDITLLGDGGMAMGSTKGTTLRWTGVAGETMIEVRGPSRARIREFGLHGNASAGKGVVVAGVDQTSGRVLFDQLRVAEQTTGNAGCVQVDPLSYSLVEMRGIYHSHSVNYPSITVKGSDVRIWGGASNTLHSLYSVQNNGQLIATDMWYAQASTRALWFENGEGNTTLASHAVSPYVKDGVKVANQFGRTTFLSNYFASTAIPNNELQLTFGGDSSTKIALIGNKVSSNATPLLVTSGAHELTLVENIVSTAAGAHSKYPDTSVDTANRVRNHLAQIRGAYLPVPTSTILNKTDLRFDRFGVKQVTATGVQVQSGGLGTGTGTGGGGTPSTAIPPGPVQHWIVQLADAPVNVPANFVGMHFNSRPLGATVAAEPSFGFGTVRSHDWDPAGSGGPQWLQIEPIQGARNTSEISSWASFYQGKQRIWTWGATPSWAASSTNTTSTWGPPGSNTPPSNLSYVTGAIQNVLDNTGVEVLEVWNEPEPHPDYPGWFYGTPTQLANMTLAVVAAVGNRNVKIVGPAYTDFDGTTGGEWKIQQLRAALPSPTYDAFSWHWYDYDGNVATTAARLHQAIASVRSMVATHFGASMPLWITEIGAFNWSASDSWSDQDHANAVGRWLMVAAAHKQQTCCLYMYESWYAGNPAGTPVVQNTIANANTNLAGKTIRQAAILTDGRVWVDFTDDSQMVDGVQTVESTPSQGAKQYIFFTLF